MDSLDKKKSSAVQQGKGAEKHPTFFEILSLLISFTALVIAWAK